MRSSVSSMYTFLSPSPHKRTEPSSHLPRIMALKPSGICPGVGTEAEADDAADSSAGSVALPVFSSRLPPLRNRKTAAAAARTSTAAAISGAVRLFFGAAGAHFTGFFPGEEAVPAGPRQGSVTSTEPIRSASAAETEGPDICTP